MTKTNQIPATVENATKPVPHFLIGLSPDQQQRMTQFSEIRVRHPALDKISESLKPVLMTNSDTNVAVVTGATGVGKSTLSKHMLKRLYADYDPLAQSDRSAIPVVYVEARSDGKVKNGFDGLFRSIIDQLREPGMNNKCFSSVKDGVLKVAYRRRHSTTDLRMILEEALVQRGTRVVVIDEAATLAGYGHSVPAMTVIRSLANSTNTKWVLVGSFDLYDVIESSGQLARRTTLLNMERYHKGEKFDSEAFKKVVTDLQVKWPCAQRPNLAEISDHLLEASLGCVGLLKTFMIDAAVLQMKNKDEQWSGRFLSDSVKSRGILEIIRKEISTGEKKVRDAVYGNCMWDEDTLSQLMQKIQPENSYAI